MSDFETILVVLAAVVLGVASTLVVQLAGAIRALSRETTAAAQKLNELITEVQPVAKRVAKLSEVVESSQGDVLKLQRSLHVLADGSVELAAAVTGARRWVNTLTPVVMASLEYLARNRPSENGHAQPSSAEHTQPATADAE